MENEMQKWLDELTISHLGCLVKYGSDGRLIFIDVPAKETQQSCLESDTQELHKIQSCKSSTTFSDDKVSEETDPFGNKKPATLKESGASVENEATKRKKKKKKKGKKSKENKIAPLNDMALKAEKLKSTFDDRCKILDELVSKMEAPDRSPKEVYTRARVHRFSYDEKKRKLCDTSALIMDTTPRTNVSGGCTESNEAPFLPKVASDEMPAIESVEKIDKVSSSLSELRTEPSVNVRSLRNWHSRRMYLQSGCLATIPEETLESSAEKEIRNLPRLPKIQDKGLVCQHTVQNQPPVFTEKHCAQLPKEMKTERNKIKLPSLTGMKNKISQTVDSEKSTDRKTKFLSRIPIRKNKVHPAELKLPQLPKLSSPVPPKTPLNRKLKLPSLTGKRNEKPQTPKTSENPTATTTKTKTKFFSRIPIMKNKVKPSELSNCPKLPKLSSPDAASKTQRTKIKLPSLSGKKDKNPQIKISENPVSEKPTDRRTKFFSRIPIMKNKIHPAELKLPQLPKLSLSDASTKLSVKTANKSELPGWWNTSNTERPQTRHRQLHATRGNSNHDE